MQPCQGREAAYGLGNRQLIVLQRFEGIMLLRGGLPGAAKCIKIAKVSHKAPKGHQESAFASQKALSRECQPRESVTTLALAVAFVDHQGPGQRCNATFCIFIHK